jgi:hypothetical protein
MPAYVFTREKDPKSISIRIRSIVKRLAPASFKEHPVLFAPDMVVKKSWRGRVRGDPHPRLSRR